MDRDLKYRDDFEKADEEGKKKMEETRKNHNEKPHEKMHAPMYEEQLKEVTVRGYFSHYGDMAILAEKIEKRKI